MNLGVFCFHVNYCCTKNKPESYRDTPNIYAFTHLNVIETCLCTGIATPLGNSVAYTASICASLTLDQYGHAQSQRRSPIAPGVSIRCLRCNDRPAQPRRSRNARSRRKYRLLCLSFEVCSPACSWTQRLKTGKPLGIGRTASKQYRSVPIKPVRLG